jgi:NAD(P)H-dependent FMN reductase
MEPLSIAVVLGSTREGRFGAAVAGWFLRHAAASPGVAAELMDPRGFRLPMFSEASPPVVKPSVHPEVTRWAEGIERADAVVFVTPEYNHGIPGVLKNLLDFGGREWARKPAAFVGYGSLGAARAVQGLRHVAIALQMAPLYRAVHLAGSDFQACRDGKDPAELPQLRQSADLLLKDLVWWAEALRSARRRLPA